MTYDVTSYLRAGRNTLGVVLGNGWHNVQPRAVWNFHEAPWRAAPKLLMKLRMLGDQGGATRIVSDDSWKTSTGPITSNGMYSGETYDARLEKPGWDTPEYDDSAWDAAEIVPSVAGRLVAQTMPPIRICETLEPVAITEPTPGVFVFDMGQNSPATPGSRFEGQGHSRHAPLRGTCERRRDVETKPLIARHLLTVDATQPFQTDSYVLKGGPEETWEARFAYHGFRYVEVTGFPGTPSASNLHGRFVHTDVQSTGEFTCSSPTANRIQQNARWSYLSNLHGIPTDCPHREKLGSTGDAHVAAEMGLYNFDSASVYQKWVRDLSDEQRKTGELPGHRPHRRVGLQVGQRAGVGQRALPHPALPLRVRRRRTCACRALRCDAPLCRLPLEPGERQHRRLRTRRLGRSGNQDTGRAHVDRVLLHRRPHRCRSSAPAWQGRGRKNLPGARHSESRPRFTPSSSTLSRGVYANGGLTAMSAALYHGLCPDHERPRVVANLVQEVAKQRHQMDCGVLGAKYLLNVLLDTGHAEDAYRLVTQKEYPGYGWQIEQGASTLWENWDGGDSQLHIMFGDVSAWLYKALAGIRLDISKPRCFVIRPNPVGGVAWAKASCMTVSGRVESEWPGVGTS